MSKKVKKFTILGGGGLGVIVPFLDMTFLPETFSDVEFALYDVNLSKAELMANFLRLLAKKRNFSASIKVYTKMEDAFAGTDFLLSRFRPGGSHTEQTGAGHVVDMNQWANDLGYFADDTAAPIATVMYLQGISTTMKAVRILEKVSPEAWFLNYTNPTQVLLDTVWRSSKIRAIGLCPGYLDSCYDISSILGGKVRPDEIKVKAAGVNHNTFVYDCKIHGKDGFEYLREEFPSVQLHTLQPFQLWGLDIFRETGYYPTPAGHMQPAFCNQFLLDRVRAGLDAHWNRPLVRGFGDSGQKSFDLIRQYVEQNDIPANDKRICDYENKPWTYSLEIDTAKALFSDETTELSLNLPNRGLLPDLPQDAIVEGPVQVSINQLEQVSVGRLNPKVIPVLKRLCDFARYLNDSYMNQDESLVLKALEAHPATSSLEQAQITARESLKKASIPKLI